MEKKTKPSVDIFRAFRGEQEIELLRWVVATNAIVLISTLILMFVAEGVFKWGILSWRNYWILFASNVLIFIYLIFSLKRDFKIWFLKYFIAISGPLLISGWIYFTDPRYTRPLFFWLMITANLIGFMFYDTNVLLISDFVAAVCVGLLLLHYSNIGFPFLPYETYLMYVIFLAVMVACFHLLRRNRIFLTELLQKRRELEEERASLKIKVKARTKELEELTKTLDEKVKERTQQLQERINQLERFGKLTIGRELRMAELKKKIQELETELKKYKS